MNLDKLIRAGCSENFDARKNQMIALCNKNSLIFALTNIFYAIAFYFLLDELYISSMLFSSSVLFFICSIGFSSLGWVNISRLSVNAIGTSLVFVMSLYLSKETQIHTILFLGAVFPFLTIKTTERSILTLSLALPIFCFIFLVLSNFTMGPKFTFPNQSTKDIIFLMATSFTYIATLVILWSFQKTREQYEDLLDDKNTEISNFINVLTHDIAQPISVVSGYHSVLRKSPNLINSLLPKLLEQDRRIRNIVDTVKELQSIKQGKEELTLDSLRISDFIEEFLIDANEIASKKEIAVLVSGASNSTVKTHRQILRNQIFMNLLTNAIKFSKKGDTIYIDLQDRDDNNAVIIKFIDTGIGMPEALKKNIFRNDVRTTRLGTSGEKGTGFGMPIVKKFVHMLGGDISVESVEGASDDVDHGTTITISVPKSIDVAQSRIKII